ncbi:HAD family hydrolase [Peptostreptococcus porci]|uniref:HAD family hydrolase n=1 Tax=Peptostreptococcus porci TaxID=2652282 RepID=UPI002A8113A2|nr:HAD family hydrolase [Peptostreptococcus porci]MDY4127267.1 HAD family hydrolase [Peptostreptococcus porci]MDY5436572.1 HAD family hydrolase [Peptostreptococcus porci]
MNRNVFFFDIDDTLYDLEYPFRLAFKKMYNYLPKNIHQIFLDFRKYNNEIYDKALNGEISMEYLCIYRTKNSFIDNGISIDDKEAMQFHLVYLDQKKHIKLEDHVRMSLDYIISKSSEIGIISNGPHKEQYNKIKYLDMYKYVDKNNIFISEDVGFHKPDSRIFCYAKKHIEDNLILNNKLQPYDIPNLKYYYIGDSFENDVIGAKISNFGSIWINHRGYDINCEKYKADFEVKTFEEFYLLIKSII